MGLSYFGSDERGDNTLRTGDEGGTLTGKSAENKTRLSTHDDGPERYIIEEEIARGGQATILRAHDQRLRRPVAIKQLRARSKPAEVRFVNEALITARLAHPSIVPIYDVGHWADGTPYFAMKLVQGETLTARIRSATDSTELIDVVLDVVDAVAYAHSERVVHRDLKPSNILVSDFGQTMVIDWGIAKVLDESPLPVTAGMAMSTRNAVLGTPGFMAPEQAAGEAVDERSDVYSLGAILYSVLAGKAPFAGVSSKEILVRLREDEHPVPLREHAPDVDAELCALVDRAMAPEPMDRFADAADMADALHDVLPDLSLSQVG